MKGKKIFKDLGVGDIVYYFYDHQIITITECKDKIQKINEIIHKFKYYNEDTGI